MFACLITQRYHAELVPNALPLRRHHLVYDLLATAPEAREALTPNPVVLAELLPDSLVWSKEGFFLQDPADQPDVIQPEQDGLTARRRTGLAQRGPSGRSE